MQERPRDSRVITMILVVNYSTLQMVGEYCCCQGTEREIIFDLLETIHKDLFEESSLY